MGCEMLYNPRDGTILTRTPASWGKIGAFYLVYYSCLAAFFAGMLAVFLFAFTDDKAPLLTGSHSVLPQNPGMGFRPMPDPEKTLIKFSLVDSKASEKDRKAQQATQDKYTDSLDDFLNNNKTHNYLQGQGSDTHLDCSKTTPPPAQYDTKPCRFRIDDYKEAMSECVNANFGYDMGTPCVAVKINKIFEFIPEVAAGESIKIDCHGEHAADKDNVGTIKMFPNDGKISLNYFPFMGQPNYIQPFVFAKFMNPQKNVLIQVECTPEAKNIKQGRQSRGDGKVVFELIVDGV